LRRKPKTPGKRREEKAFLGMEALLVAAAARADEFESCSVGDVARSLLFSDDGERGSSGPSAASSSSISSSDSASSTTPWNTSTTMTTTIAQQAGVVGGGGGGGGTAKLWFNAKTIQKKGLVEFQLTGIKKNEWIRTKEAVYQEDYYATKRPRTNKATGKLITKREPQTHAYELDAAIFCDGQKVLQL